MSLKRRVFFPTSAISVGVVGVLTRYLPKLCTRNVTKVNNEQHETKWLLVLRAGVQRPHKTRSTTSNFSCFHTPYATNSAQFLKTRLHYQHLELLVNANRGKHSKQ